MTIETHRTIRCRAHNRRGEPCSAFPIHGGKVCVTHGGAAPHVKAAADQRLKALAPNAVDVLEELLNATDEASAIRLAAARDILDRAGYSAKQRIEHSGDIQSGRSLTAEQAEAIERALLRG